MLKRLFGSSKQEIASPDAIIIVSGLPRSGTSMMMNMLKAGGIETLTDGIREADIDNPEGYYEFERVKQLPKGDDGWLADTRGKAVKVIAPLLEYLPNEYTYRVILMRRQMNEILASQKRMLAHRGEDSDRVDDRELSMLFERHLAQVQKWLEGRSRTEVLHVDYNEMLIDPLPHVRRVAGFLGRELDQEAMAQVIDPKLYRNRSGT